MARSNNFSRIMDSILAAEPVYIKGTGVRVMITDVDYRKGQREVCGRIKFLDAPTKSAIMLCEEVALDVRDQSVNKLGAVNSPPPTPQWHVMVNCLINLDNLSVTPYESKAAKVLYKKQNK